MSEMFQVTIVVPAEKLGALLSALPPKLQPQISRLVERGPPRGKYNARGENGEYQPAKGTTGEALLKLLQRSGPRRPKEIRDVLCKTERHKPQGVSSALGRLVHFKLVRRFPNGTYGVIE
jgi:hypothetical protein